MIVTEEEAKKKRCQESFAAGHAAYADGTPIRHPVADEIKKYYGGADFTVTNYAPVNCIGSACMAWRWHVWNTHPETGQRISGTAGYCGKAGKP